MLVAGQALGASYAMEASKLANMLEDVVLLVEIREESSHARNASALVVCSPVLVAESPVMVKIRICSSRLENLNCGLMVTHVGHPQQQSLPRDSGGPRDQDAEQDGKCDAVGLGVRVHVGQEAHHDLGAPSGQGEYGRVHHGRGIGDHVHGHQCGGGRGGSELGYFPGGQESGELRDQYKTSSTFLSSPDVAQHASVLAAKGSCQLFGAVKRHWAGGVASCCSSCGNTNNSSVANRTQ